MLRHALCLSWLLCAASASAQSDPAPSLAGSPAPGAPALPLAGSVATPPIALPPKPLNIDLPIPANGSVLFELPNGRSGKIQLTDATMQVIDGTLRMIGAFAV